MKNRQTTVRVRSFRPAPKAAPVNVPVRRFPIVSKADLSHADLWQWHYQEALNNGNTHKGAERFANLICR